MKTNVKIYKHTNYDIDVEIKYYVYEKDRKVVCVITNLHREEVELEKILRKHFGHLELPITHWIKPRSVCGIAICHENDKFDEKIGMRIAYKNAKNKRHSDHMQTLCDLKNSLNNWIQTVDLIRDKMKQRIKKLNDAPIK